MRNDDRNMVISTVPDGLADASGEKAEALGLEKADSLLEAYRQMAADQRQESEAEEWCEGLIGDAF